MRSPVGAGHQQRLAKILAASRGVVTAEIYRLAEFCESVHQSLAGFADAERHDRATLGLQHVGSPFEAGGAFIGRRRGPIREGADGAGDRAIDILRGRIDHAPYCLAEIGGIAQRLTLPAGWIAADDRRGLPGTLRGRFDLGPQRHQGVEIGEVDALRIAALGAVDA